MNIALVLAGGTGTRMRTNGFPKQYIEIKGKPVLLYTLEKFQACADVSHIVVVAHAQWEEKILQWAKTYGIDKFAGIAHQGDSRQESVYNGLEACMKLDPQADDLVLIHDSARPLVTPELISACVKGAAGHDGCLPVIAVKDTIYYSRDGKAIHDLTDRSSLFCGQSPEVLKLRPYLELCRNLSAEQMLNIRGSCELAFRNGWDICMIPGEEYNFKLTTAEDMSRLRKLLEES